MGNGKCKKTIKPNYGLEFKAEEADGRNIEICTFVAAVGILRFQF